MLQNAYFLAKIGADTAENEQHFAEMPGGAPPCRPVPSLPMSPEGVAAVAAEGALEGHHLSLV